MRNNNGIMGRARSVTPVLALARLAGAFVAGLILLVPNHASAVDDGPVVKVNGAIITRRDLESEIDKLLPRMSYHGAVSKDVREEYREHALDQLIDRELQYQDAAAKGGKPDAEKVEQRMSNMRGQFPSKKEYKKALEQAGLTEARLKRQVEKDVLVTQHVERMVIARARLSPEDLKDYYTRNPSKFAQPETVHIRILTSKDEKKAREAYALIKGGEAFGSVAGKMSEDNFRIKGGDIGFIHRGRLLPELEDAAFGMKPGEVSEVTKAENAWFILTVEESRPARQLPFDEVKDKLQKELETKRAKEIMDQWMAELKSRAKIEMLLTK